MPASSRPRGVPVLRAFALILMVLFLAVPLRTPAQGETTSAIDEQVTDASGGVIPGATVTITNRDTGSQRSLKTDDEGRFNFPQLRPGTYSVKVEAAGFDSLQTDNVFSGLGQKQTVNFRMKVAQSQQTVEVTGAPPLINPGNANTATNLKFTVCFCPRPENTLSVCRESKPAA